MSARSATAPDRRRLLLVSQPLEGGVTRHVLDLVRGLDPDVYQIDVACPRASDLWASLEGTPGVRRYAIAPNRQPTLADGVTLGRLLALAKRADIIHAHSSKAGFLARLAAAAHGRASACIFTPHGWSFWSGRGAKARAYRSLERMAARWCRTIIAVSEYERRAGLAHRIGAPEQYRVIRNGVDLQRFDGRYAPVSGRVLMVGRLAAPKRPDLAIRAVQALRSRFPNLALDLVGDGPERRRIEDLIADLGLRDRVRVLGSRHDVPALLSSAQCVVLASDSEACPLSVIEGMAAGAPVVASRVGGMPEIMEAGATGILTDPGSVEALATALGDVLSDPQRAQRMGEAGRRRAQREFSSRAMVDDIVRAYDEVASAPAVQHRRTAPVTTA